jgi:hypothetical protein
MAPGFIAPVRRRAFRVVNAAFPESILAPGPDAGRHRISKHSEAVALAGLAANSCRKARFAAGRPQTGENHPYFRAWRRRALRTNPRETRRQCYKPLIFLIFPTRSP